MIPPTPAGYPDQKGHTRSLMGAWFPQRNINIPAKYTTLGPKNVCCSKMAITRRRSKLWWRTAHQSKALVETYLSTVSKRDLKPSGTQILNLLAPAGILRQPFYKIFQKSGPCGHIKGALLQNIKKRKTYGHIKGALLQYIKKKNGSCGNIWQPLFITYIYIYMYMIANLF